MKQFFLTIVFILCLISTPSFSQDALNSLEETKTELANQAENEITTTLVADTNATKIETDSTLESTNKTTIIPSEGFSFGSLWRGVLGMIALPLID